MNFFRCVVQGSFDQCKKSCNPYPKQNIEHFPHPQSSVMPFCLQSLPTHNLCEEYFSWITLNRPLSFFQMSFYLSPFSSHCFWNSFRLFCVPIIPSYRCCAGQSHCKIFYCGNITYNLPFKLLLRAIQWHWL